MPLFSAGVQTQDLYDPREQWASYLTNALQSRNTVFSARQVVLSGMQTQDLYDP